MNGVPRGPRPLDYIRVRYYRGGQAEYIRGLFEDEKEGLFEELGKLRGKPPTPKAQQREEEIQQELRHLINALRDLDTGMVELVGPDGF